MRRSVLMAAMVVAAMSQSCSRHTSECAQSAASLRSTTIQRAVTDDSLSLVRDYILLVDSPTIHIVRADSSRCQSIILSGRNAVIASRTESLSTRRSSITATDSLAADSARVITESRDSRPSPRWLLLLAALAATVVTLRLSLRGIGSRR